MIYEIMKVTPSDGMEFFALIERDWKIMHEGDHFTDGIYTGAVRGHKEAGCRQSEFPHLVKVLATSRPLKYTTDNDVHLIENFKPAPIFKCTRTMFVGIVKALDVEISDDSITVKKEIYELET